MKIYLYLFILPLFFIHSQYAIAQEVKIIKFPELESLINEKTNENEVRVFNFWATWCKPCIKELPYFESVNNTFKEKNVKVYLVSLDFAKLVDTKVRPFLKKKNIQSEVLLLDETDYDYIINSIDKNWSGTIPATLLVNSKTNKKAFFEKEFKEGELEILINNYIN